MYKGLTHTSGNAASPHRHLHQDVHSSQTVETSRPPLTAERIKETLRIIQRVISAKRRNEVLMSATTWMNLKQAK